MKKFYRFFPEARGYLTSGCCFSTMGYNAAGFTGNGQRFRLTAPFVSTNGVEKNILRHPNPCSSSFIVDVADKPSTQCCMQAISTRR